MTPEEAARIDEVARSDRPLIVCDVDEVVLEFVSPFMAFLDSHGHELRANSFALSGNVYFKETGEPADRAAVSDFLKRFFAEHDTWQGPVDGALDTLAQIETAHEADIVFLTAMPPHHHGRRRQLLDRHGFLHPMIATEGAKGDAVATLLRHNPRRPVAFIDDLPPNHVSVLEAVPGAFGVQLMAYRDFVRYLPPMPEGVTSVEDWPAAAKAIAEYLAEHGR